MKVWAAGTFNQIRCIFLKVNIDKTQVMVFLEGQTQLRYKKINGKNFKLLKSSTTLDAS